MDSSPFRAGVNNYQEKVYQPHAQLTVGSCESTPSAKLSQSLAHLNLSGVLVERWVLSQANGVISFRFTSYM